MTTPIGVFDSGYGGLTILKSLQSALPQYDFIYLGDNARTPYGTRSYEVVYQYTLEAVKFLFSQGCPLVILACNTASAKALRTIQQQDLQQLASNKRVLGVIRPTVEKVEELTRNGHVGVLATNGTVASESYPIELKKWTNGKVKHIAQQACPLWVPIVESNQINTKGADYFIQKDIALLFEQDKKIDTLILGCTHYPLLLESIKQYTSPNVEIVTQGSIVAEKLMDYLNRHPEIDNQLSRSGITQYLTTEDNHKFEESASLFLGKQVKSKKVQY